MTDQNPRPVMIPEQLDLGMGRCGLTADLKVSPATYQQLASSSGTHAREVSCTGGVVEDFLSPVSVGNQMGGHSGRSSHCKLETGLPSSPFAHTPTQATFPQKLERTESKPQIDQAHPFSSTPNDDSALRSGDDAAGSSEGRKRRAGRAGAGASKPKTPNFCTKHVRQRKTRLRPQNQLLTGKRKYRCETCSEILDTWVKENGLKLTPTNKKILLDRVGMSRRQLDNWFCNRRRLERVSQQESSELSLSEEDEEQGLTFLSPDELQMYIPSEEMEDLTSTEASLSPPLVSPPLQHFPDEVFSGSTSLTPSTTMSGFPASESYSRLQFQFLQQNERHQQHERLLQATPTTSTANRWDVRHKSESEKFQRPLVENSGQTASIIRRSSAPNLWLQQHPQASKLSVQQQTDFRVTQSIPPVCSPGNMTSDWISSASQFSPTCQSQWPFLGQFSSSPSTTLKS